MATKPAAAGALERFTLAAAEIGIEVAPVRYPQGTRTAKDAAAAIGCDISQIVKSLVLSAGGECILALTAGHNRVDLEKLSDIVGRGVEMANAEQARRATGYAIGGTPPFGHVDRLLTYIDPALMTHKVVYAAAGRPDTCFAITPEALAEASKGALADFAAG